MTEDQVVLLLVGGISLDAIRAQARRQGVSAARMRRLVAGARKKLAGSAGVARDEYLGKSVIRLEDLYSKAMAAKDVKSALQAQRELNRLLSLHKEQDSVEKSLGEGSEAQQRLDLIQAYLLPLGLIPAEYPVEEHARVAADVIRQHGLMGKTNVETDEPAGEAPAVRTAEGTTAEEIHRDHPREPGYCSNAGGEASG